MKTINDYVTEAHQNALDHGWHDEPRTFGEIIALIHSEASEALEEFRAGRGPNQMDHKCSPPAIADACLHPTESCAATGCPYFKPEGIPSELADIVIRVFDACGYYGIDLQVAIEEKMAYNRTRPYKHGGKVL